MDLTASLERENEGGWWCYPLQRLRNKLKEEERRLGDSAMTNDQLPTSRKEAVTLGSRFYLNPSTPCKQHGVQQRYTSTRRCVKCSQADGRKKNKSVNPEQYAADQKRQKELAALREQYGPKIEFDFVEPLTVSERALITTVFCQLLRFQCAANLGREFVEICERHRDQKIRSTNNNDTDNDDD